MLSWSSPLPVLPQLRGGLPVGRSQAAGVVPGGPWEPLEGTSFLEGVLPMGSSAHLVCISLSVFSSAASDWIYHRLTFSIISYNVFF